MKTNIRVSAVILAAVMAAAGCASDKASGGGSTGADGVKQGPGVTDKVIKLGAITDQTGAYAAPAKGITQAEQLRIEEINKAGGICGRQLELVVRDGGYDVQKSMAAYSELQGSVLALPQVIGSHVVAALDGRITSDKILSLPMAWSNEMLGNQYIQVTGPTYDVDMINAVDWMVKSGALKKGGKLGHIYMDNDYGLSASAGAKYAAEKHGVTYVDTKIRPTDTDLTNQAGGLYKQGIDALLLGTSPTQTGSAVGVIRVAGFKGVIMGSNSSFHAQLVANEKLKPAMLKGFYFSTAGVPIDEDMPALKKLDAAYKAKYPKDPRDSSVVIGYTTIEIMENALKKACADKDLTRDGLIKAHRSTNAFDNGQGGTLDFTSFDKPPSLKSFILQPTEGTTNLTKIVQDRMESPLLKDYKVPVK